MANVISRMTCIIYDSGCNANSIIIVYDNGCKVNFKAILSIFLSVCLSSFFRCVLASL